MANLAELRDQILETTKDMDITSASEADTACAWADARVALENAKAHEAKISQSFYAAQERQKGNRQRLKSLADELVNSAIVPAPIPSFVHPVAVVNNASSFQPTAG